MLYNGREISHSGDMDNTITTITPRQSTTEKVLVYTDINAEDAEKLDVLTKASAVPKGIILANLVYLQSLKAQQDRQNTPAPQPTR